MITHQYTPSIPLTVSKGDAPLRPEAREFWQQGQAGGRPPAGDLPATLCTSLSMLQEGGLQMSPSPQTPQLANPVPV